MKNLPKENQNFKNNLEELYICQKKKHFLKATQIDTVHIDGVVSSKRFGHLNYLINTYSHILRE